MAPTGTIVKASALFTIAGTYRLETTESFTGHYRTVLICPDSVVLPVGAHDYKSAALALHEDVSGALNAVVTALTKQAGALPRPAPAYDVLARTISIEGDRYEIRHFPDGRHVIGVQSKSGGEYELERKGGVIRCSCPSQTKGGRDYCRHSDYARAYLANWLPSL